jgi:hypothetical protein
LPPRPSRWPRGQGSSPPPSAWPAAFLFCPVVLAGAEIPASGCTDRVRRNPVRYPISYTAGSGSRSDPGPPNVPPIISRQSHRPLPYASPHRRTRVPFRRPGAEHRHPGAPANSPRHHAGTSAACRRPRSGRYECRHHRRPTVVAGENNRRYARIAINWSQIVRYILLSSPLATAPAPRDPRTGKDMASTRDELSRGQISWRCHEPLSSWAGSGLQRSGPTEVLPGVRLTCRDNARSWLICLWAHLCTAC